MPNHELNVAVEQVAQCLGFPPRAVTFLQICQETGLPGDLVEQAFRKLLEDERAGYSGAWLFGARPNRREPMSRDDLQWLMGTGRYSQE
jgi:hypothetical protein